MQIPTLKSFEYHNFLRDVLRREDQRAYFLANQHNFQQGALPRFPYRNYFYGLGIAVGGSRQIRIGTKVFEMKAHSVMMIGPGVLRQWLDDHFLAEHSAIFFTSELFQSPIHPHFLSELPLFKPNIQHVLELPAADFEAVQQLFSLLDTFEQQESIVSGLVLSLIETFTHLQNKQNGLMAQSAVPNSRVHQILNDFDVLLQKHYLENHHVSFYADMLNLTSNHMSEAIKEATGKSAKKRIDELLLLEAKSLLKQTNMTIKEVTYWLGFDDPSYFIKFFKQSEGMTPLAYKKA
jgi:AraC family transcriptional regulator, transcriptional activator of pobA